MNNETKKPVNKKMIAILLIGIVMAIAAISAIIVFRSDKFTYRDIVTTSSEFVYTEDDLEHLAEGDECYLILSDLDYNGSKTSYRGYLLDSKKQKTNAEVIIEVPVMANWIDMDACEAIVRADYIQRTKLTIDGVKSKFYQFKALSIATLDNDYKIDSEVVDISVLEKRDEVKIGDSISALLTPGWKVNFTKYEGDPYVVFNYVSIDYDYDEFNADYEIKSDKQFIIKNDEKIFHIELNSKYDEFNDMRKSYLQVLSLSVVNAKVVDIVDDYYVLSIDDVEPTVFTSIEENGTYYKEDDIYTIESFKDFLFSDTDERFDVDLMLFGNDKELEKEYGINPVETKAKENVEKVEEFDPDTYVPDFNNPMGSRYSEVYPNYENYNLYFQVFDIENEYTAKIKAYDTMDQLYSGCEATEAYVYIDTSDLFVGYTGYCTVDDTYVDEAGNYTLTNPEFLDLYVIYGEEDSYTCGDDDFGVEDPDCGWD